MPLSQLIATMAAFIVRLCSTFTATATRHA
jgi:hypothetical protein